MHKSHYNKLATYKSGKKPIPSSLEESIDINFIEILDGLVK